MDSQIVSIDDLKEYDDKVKPYIANKAVLIGSDGESTKLKISIVSTFPATADSDTIYVIPNSSIIDISQIPQGNIKIGNTPITGIYIGDTRIW